MPTYFQRPENALKRANEFIDVGKKQRALDALYDVIKSKKHRTWQKIHEPIMEKYLQLCVELRKSHIAKEGLYQYKNICQQVNIKSLEDVVRKYINLAEFKTEEARKESHQAVVDIDDLDNPDTPESLLLKAVSGEDTQDRTDRAILTPWVKFLWESYRQCLDLLRNNSRVERLYQDIAQQAFKFCLKYARKTEFRKLCDNLRTHLTHAQKHQHQQTSINLNNPDSQGMHLETRLEQLDSAIKMELWQEAFKAVEDIHGLIQLSRKPPKPSLMANYYQKLGMVFWKSGNALFHASTLHRLYVLSREQRKNLSQEELHKMASKVLCATLAVPIPPSRNPIDQLLETDESTMEKTKRLATLVMLNSAPTRQGLIKDLVKYNVMQYVHPELQNLFKYLETEFHPLRLFEKVKSSIEFIVNNEDLCQYNDFLENIIITRVLKQISQVYQTIAFDRIADLIPFASKFRLERVMVNAARTLDLQVRIDHRNKSLSFGTDLMVAQKEDVPEGPYIQSMPSERIRNQLIGMAHALNEALNSIQPKEIQIKRDELKVQIAQSYKVTMRKDHQRILSRRQVIEDRKEQLEHLNCQREREEMELVEEQKKKAYEAEMMRLEREAKERERQRKLEEHKEIQKKHAMERIEQLKKTDIGAKVLQNLDEEDFARLDVDDIMAKQVEQLEKEKKELMDRLKNQEKKIDYFARAKRLEEIPLLIKQYEEERKLSREFWEQQEAERIEQLKKEREVALLSQKRLSRMKKERDEFMAMLRGQRKEQFKKKTAEFEAKLSQERKVRLLERKERRKEERRIKWLKEKEEEEQRIRDEALKQEREERDRLESAKIEAEKQEYEAKLAKLEEQAARQRQREKEIEEREARRREEMAHERTRDDRGMRGRDPPPSDQDTWRRGGESTDEPRSEGGAWRPSGQGGWREREKQRSDSWRKESSPTKRPDDRWGRDGDDRPPMRDDDRGDGWRSRAPAQDDRGDAWRRDDRGLSDRGFRSDRGPSPRDGWRDRGGPRDDRDMRGPPRDDRDMRGPPRDDRDMRGPPRDDRDMRGPPRDDRDMRGPPRDDRDMRGPPRDDRDMRGPPRDFRDGGSSWRDRAPPRDDRDSWRDRAPPRDDRMDRGPPRDDRGPPRDERRGGDSWRDRRGPSDDRPPMRGGDREGGSGGAWRPGGGSWRDRAGGDRDRGGDRGGDRDTWRGRDDRGPPPRGDDRRGGGGERDSWRSDSRQEGGWRDRQDKSRRGGDEEGEGWTKVKY